MFDVEMRIKSLLLRSCLMLTNMKSENIDLLVVLKKKDVNDPAEVKIGLIAVLFCDMLTALQRLEWTCFVVLKC